MSWPTRSLASIIEKHGGLIQTGPFGSQLHQSDYTDTGVPVVMPKDIKGGRVDEASVARVTEEKAAQLSRHMLKPDSIVFPRRGEISKCAYIAAPQAGFLCGTGCIKIEVPQEVLLPKFLHYYLGLRHVVEWLERNAIGTTMLNLNTGILGGIQVPEISTPQQARIVEVLSAYDDLIENNRRRIELLEQAARLLYKEWFVHLRFPGHEHVRIQDGVPEGWERRQVKNLLAKVHRPRRILKTDFLDDGPIPCVDQSREFIGGYTDDEDAVIDADKPVIVFGDHTRILKFIDFSFACGADGTQLIISNDSAITQEYLYFALDALELSDYFYARHFKFLKDQYILCPWDEYVAQFTTYVRPMMKQISGLREQSHGLTKARDLLLPRLMSGEIAV